MDRTTALLFTLALTGSVLAGAATAADYFVDSEMGADANAGTSAAAPFQSLARLAAVPLQPGDTARLRRGRTFRGTLACKGNGTEEQPIRVDAYGEGSRPEILGSLQAAGWDKHEGEVYRLTIPKERFSGGATVPYSVFEVDPDRIPVRLQRDQAIPTAHGHYFYDAASATLYLITSDGAPPSRHRIEVPVVTQLVDLTGRAFVDVQNLAFLFGNCRHVVASDCHDCTIRNCASLFVGNYGNPNVSLLRCTRVQVVGCFLYENANCGVFISDGSTRCLVSGCTIVKCSSNDGVTIHSGARDANGVFQGQAGNYNTVQGNVIGLCPEESIDITSGDYHHIEGNICYGNGNPGIIVGHDSDHMMIYNNISFANARAGIQVSGSQAEGARGENAIVQNLVYGNGYPGLEIDAPQTMILNNTVIGSRERAAVRFSPASRGCTLRNNLVATLDAVGCSTNAR